MTPSSITDYAPTTGAPCPQSTTGSLVRSTSAEVQKLNIQEESYLDARESYVIPNAWSDWVGDCSSIGYNPSLLNGTLPRIGIAVGGQGYRAAQFGAGVFSALDARNSTAKIKYTGGLLQVTSYLAGSSGGSWLTASLALNDWPNPSALVFGDRHNLSGWMLDLDLLAPSGPDPGDVNNRAYWASLLSSVQAKASVSIDTSITDLLGRAVSYHFLNQTTRDNFYTNKTGHGAGLLWSQIPLLPSYETHQAMPFPIIVADSIPSGAPATSPVPLDSVVYEFTPFEFGSWDPSLSAMFPIAYAGTHLMNGTTSNSSACVTGFDQVGFLMGTSASNFSAGNSAHGNFPGFTDQHGELSAIQFLYDQLSSRVKSRSLYVANWPNAFQGVSPSTFKDSSSEWLSLADGGSNQEQLPLGSLLTKAREVDVVVAVDASADDPDRWPDGTTLLTSSRRISSLLSSSHQAFPPIPSSTQDFVSAGLNLRPTFFGCNPSQNPPEYPLIIYIPNSPPYDGSAPSSNTENINFFSSLLSTAVVTNQAFYNTLAGFNPNTTLGDPNWGRCLQCAALDRARSQRTPVPPRSGFCTQCFSQYCYDPQNPPSANAVPRRLHSYTDPDPGALNKVESFVSHHKGALIGGMVGVGILIGVGIALIFWWRRRAERKNRYTRMDELREDDEPWKYYDSYSAGTHNEMRRL